jgi:outer membrane protein
VRFSGTFTIAQTTPRLLAVAMLLLSAPVFCDDLLIPSVTLDQYVTLAIEKGIQGKLRALTLESAGYRREIAFRQTDSPSFTLGHEHTKSETKTTGPSGFDSISDSKESTLTMNENLPTGTNITASGLYGDSHNPGFNASVTQPLYLFVWNAALRTRRSAELNFANAKDTYDAAVLSLRTQSRSLYYEVMLGEESIKVEQRKVESSKKLLDITQALVQGGKTAPIETMRAKIRLQEDERQLENAMTTRDKSILSAKNFVYLPLDEPVHFTSNLQFKPLELSVNRLIEYAMLHNPQLKSLRRDQELAHYATQIAIEPTRPTLSLTSTFGSNELPGTVSHAWSLGGKANWLFFDSFVTRDQVRIARIDEFVAGLNLLDAERTTKVNVQNAYLDVKNAEKQIKTFQFSREQTVRNVEVLRLRFQNGLDRLIDVFDAENDMRNLDNEYLGLVVGFNRSKDSLSELLGADVETIR